MFKTCIKFSPSPDNPYTVTESDAAWSQGGRVGLTWQKKELRSGRGRIQRVEKAGLKEDNKQGREERRGPSLVGGGATWPGSAGGECF